MTDYSHFLLDSSMPIRTFKVLIRKFKCQELEHHYLKERETEIIALKLQIKCYKCSLYVSSEKKPVQPSHRIIEDRVSKMEQKLDKLTSIYNQEKAAIEAFLTTKEALSDEFHVDPDKLREYFRLADGAEPLLSHYLWWIYQEKVAANRTDNTNGTGAADHECSAPTPADSPLGEGAAAVEDEIEEID